MSSYSPTFSADRRSVRVALLVGAIALLTTGLILLSGTPSSADAGDAPITGAIHVDYDRDGELDPGEESLTDRPNLTLTVWDVDKGSAPCALNADDAGYSCDVTSIGAGPFTLVLEADGGFSDSFTGSAYGPMVQRADAGAALNFGIAPPSQCSAAGGGELFVPCFVAGDHLSDTGYQDTLVTLPFDNSTAPTTIAEKSDTGAIWGVAYDEYEDIIYTSAFLKRHADFGPDGAWAVYWSADDGATWQSFNAASGTAISRDLAGVAANETSYDEAAFSNVGKYGLGDIDLTPDRNTLLVSNLADNTVEVIDVTAVAGGGAAVPGATLAVGANGCAGDHQIFGLKAIDASTALVGVSCTGPTQADLQAKVVRLDLTDGSESSVLDIPLQYSRPCAGTDYTGITFDLCNASTANGDTIVNGAWQAWSDDYADYGVIARPGSAADVVRPQALLSDIEITDDGGLVLGITDRTSHQIGNRNCVPDAGSPCVDSADLIKTIQEGEILRVCNTGTLAAPVYAVEGQAGCDTNFATVANPVAADPAIDANNGQYATGPYSADGEFFEDVFKPADFATDGTPHGEIASGGLYYQPYSDLVVATTMNPGIERGAGGLKWFNTESGASVDGRNLYIYSDDVDGGSFAKAAGIPDVEGCFNPIQIGDFVWFDADGDGVQNGDEPAIGGVTVTLVDKNNPDGLTYTTTTDANGYYTFGPDSGVTANGSYTLSFDVTGADKTITGLPAGVTAADLVATTPNAGGNDMIDSDMVDGSILFDAGDVSNHTLDAGFTVPVEDVYDLALELSPAPDSLTIVTVGDDIVTHVEVTNEGNVSSDEYELTVYIPTGLVLNDADWTDNGDGTATYNGDDATKLEPGESVKIPVTMTAETPGAKELTFAEISDDAGDDVDSTPDADNGGVAESEAEDDHDSSTVTVVAADVYDLALTLTQAPDQGAVVSVGDSVVQHITVLNQGNVSSGDYEITITIPAGLELDDATWTDNGDGSATYSGDEAVKLESGDSVKIPVALTAVAESAKDHTFAEISSDSGDDVDSTADADNGGFDESPSNTDNDVDADEDDHDFETITVSAGPAYDLALKIEPAPGTPDAINVGDNVVQHVTVVNQGNVDSGDYELTVFIPSGLELDDDTWTDNGDGSATYSGDEAGNLAPGEETKISITFTTLAVGDLQVFAEISSDSGDDIDSTSDADNGGIAESGTSEDNDLVMGEDDHDIEVITVIIAGKTIRTIYNSVPVPNIPPPTIVPGVVVPSLPPIFVTATPVPTDAAKSDAAAGTVKKAATPTPTAKKATPLAVTGNNSSLPVLLASSLLVAGGTVLLLSRRRQGEI